MLMTPKAKRSYVAYLAILGETHAAILTAFIEAHARARGDTKVRTRDMLIGYTNALAAIRG